MDQHALSPRRAWPARLRGRFAFITLTLVATVPLWLVSACSGPNITANWHYIRTDGDMPHPGVDFASRYGPVLAASNGVVVRVDTNQNETSSICSSRIVQLIPDFDKIIIYCGLVRIDVAAGQPVNRGEVVGRSGNRLHLTLLPTYACDGGYDGHCYQFEDNIDPLAREYNGGCYNPTRIYPDDRFVLTYPILC